MVNPSGLAASAAPCSPAGPAVERTDAAFSRGLEAVLRRVAITVSIAAVRFWRSCCSSLSTVRPMATNENPAPTRPATTSATAVRPGMSRRSLALLGLGK